MEGVVLIADGLWVLARKMSGGLGRQGVFSSRQKERRGLRPASIVFLLSKQSWPPSLPWGCWTELMVLPVSWVLTDATLKTSYEDRVTATERGLEAHRTEMHHLEIRGCELRFLGLGC